MISRIEKQLKRRFAIGSQVSEHSIIQDFTKQVRISTWGHNSDLTLRPACVSCSIGMITGIVFSSLLSVM